MTEKVFPSIAITTERFQLRALTPSDATPRYSAWLDEADAQRHISGAKDRHDVPALRAFIDSKIGRADVLFLGIFTKEKTHIGNIKYEPIVPKERYAVMGILIGDPAWRGKGVASEVIRASARWLQQNRGIEEILLGVDKANASAIRAYEKAGFSATAPERLAIDRDRGLAMAWKVS